DRSVLHGLSQHRQIAVFVDVIRQLRGGEANDVAANAVGAADYVMPGLSLPREEVVDRVTELADSLRFGRTQAQYRRAPKRFALARGAMTRVHTGICRQCLMQVRLRGYVQAAFARIDQVEV